MLTSGDVVDLDLGSPKGREAGTRRPVVVVTAREILDESVNVVQVVPLTSTVRPFGSEVEIEADAGNGSKLTQLRSASTSGRCRSIELSQ